MYVLCYPIARELWSFTSSTSCCLLACIVFFKVILDFWILQLYSLKKKKKRSNRLSWQKNMYIPDSKIHFQWYVIERPRSFWELLCKRPSLLSKSKFFRKQGLSLPTSIRWMNIWFVRVDSDISVYRIF